MKWETNSEGRHLIGRRNWAPEPTGRQQKISVKNSGTCTRGGELSSTKEKKDCTKKTKHEGKDITPPRT